jgi:hypothetical protein
LLKFPPTADEALTEALDAHLIVFAGRSAQSLPFWLERWHRQIKDAALAVVSAGSSKALSSAPAKSDLSQFAKRHDLNVIFDDNIKSIPSVIEDKPSSVEEFADQPIFVKAAISGVAREGVIAAALSALMIPLFLG